MNKETNYRQLIIHEMKLEMWSTPCTDSVRIRCVHQYMLVLSTEWIQNSHIQNSHIQNSHATKQPRDKTATPTKQPRDKTATLQNSHTTLRVKKQPHF